MALNSFENRVYEVEIQSDEPPKNPSEHRRIVKFYRPQRWTEAQILEEHQFIRDLGEAEIPAIAPMEFSDGKTLHRDPESGIFYAVFPKVGGRAPDELTSEQFQRIGRLIARIHNVGVTRKAPHRLKLTPETYGRKNLEFLLSGNWIPIEFTKRYEVAVRRICEMTETWFQEASYQRIHGDCHLGNLLLNNEGYFFLDFDDMVQGPPVQDLWLVLGARGQEARPDLESLLRGYEEMRAFDHSTLRLIEPLRALRFIHYAAWIARRWEDPAFPQAFPQFGSHRYWSDQTDDLELQLRIISETAQGE